jgi:hypothetical protein
MVGGEAFVAVHVPREIVEKAKRKGFDVELLVVESIAEKLGLDPREEASIHVKLAEKFLEEAKKFIEQGDAVQASEKLYKVAEECVKALAIMFRAPEVEEARREGRWWTKLLSRASKKLSLKLKEPIISYGWSVGYDLHVWGFHEASLDIDSVKAVAPIIEQLLAKTKEIIRRQG